MVQRSPRRVTSFLSFFLFCSTLKAASLVQLQLDAPAQCPSKDSIEQTLARLVERAPSSPLVVNARLAPDGDRWVLVVMLEGGQRVVSGDSCVAVAEALVVIMALAIDPANPVNPAALQDFERANLPPAQPAAPPAAPTAPPIAPVPGAAAASHGGGHFRRFDAEEKARASAPQWPIPKPDGWGVSALMLGEWGALPKPSIGPTIVVRYGSPLRWGELSTSALYPRMKYEDASSTKGARFRLLAAQAAGCVALGSELPLGACAGVELGDLVGQGVNTSADETRHTFWSALAGGFVFRGNLGGDWGLELRLGAAVPVRRRDFAIDGSNFRFTPARISGRGQFGLSWR